MLEKERYANGQRIWQITDDRLTYFFADGTLKAEGPYLNGLMEGEWHFYRQTGQLWVVGNFSQGQKSGRWTRWDKGNKIEYDETFTGGKLVSRK